MARFELDAQAVERAANEATKRLAAELQRKFDQVHHCHAGTPLADTKAAIGIACGSVGITPSEEQLEAWAQAISDGTRIVINAQAVRSQS